MLAGCKTPPGLQPGKESLDSERSSGGLPPLSRLDAVGCALKSVASLHQCLPKSPMKRRWQRGLYLLTDVRRNVKNHLLPLLDKLLPRKRSTIKTLFATLRRGMGHPATTLPSAPFSISSSARRPAPWPNNSTAAGTQSPSPISLQPYPELGLHQVSYAPCHKGREGGKMPRSEPAPSRGE